MSFYLSNRGNINQDEADAYEAIAKQLEDLVRECKINIKEFHEPEGTSRHNEDYKFHDCIGALCDVIEDCRFQTARLIVQGHLNGISSPKSEAS